MANVPDYRGQKSSSPRTRTVEGRYVGIFPFQMTFFHCFFFFFFFFFDVAGKEGVRDGKMGTCAECNQPIFGVLIQVGTKNLHPDCHFCRRCKRVFADGETFVRDNSKHTICDQCVTAEHDKRVAARPPMQEEIQVLGSKALGTCGSCRKDIFDSCVTVMNDKFHDACWNCLRCKKQLRKGDGCVREGSGFLCESCC